jgi:hypothetical protein
MIRAKWFGVVRVCYESVESVVLAGGWSARLAYGLGLQGDVVSSIAPRNFRVLFAWRSHPTFTPGH